MKNITMRATGNAVASATSVVSLMTQVVVVVLMFTASISTVMGETTTQQSSRPTMMIYASMPSSNKDLSAVARKQKYDLDLLAAGTTALSDGSMVDLKIQYFTIKEQRTYIQNHGEECGGDAALKVFDSLQNMNLQIQTEIFKWCALATTTASGSNDMVTYIDSSCPIINTNAIAAMMTNPKVNGKKNVIVMDDSTSTVHGSYIQLVNNAKNREFSTKMVHFITSKTDLEVLQSHTVLIPRTVYDYVTNDDYVNDAKENENNSKWYKLHLSCRNKGGGNTKDNGDAVNGLVRDPYTCATGYCCSIQDTMTQTTLFLSRNYILPTQMIPQHNTLPTPIYHRNKNSDATVAAGTAEMNDIPFISTVTIKELPLGDHHKAAADTPYNFYELLEKDDCLPSNDHCTKCLREKGGAKCSSGPCREHCSCYCTKLCHTTVPNKPIVQEWTITPPIYSKNPHRLIPRIVHQTWFELMDTERYPNMSRLVESFKRSGWDYRFYTDDDIVTFLQIHYPPEVLQAYDALIPGAFKADLFRYCVLLIYGGVYADVDIQLQSALDLSIPDDVGFMVPMDEPGKPVNKQMCVWNGLIASAPSHPFLVKAIETIVNQVRNRFTSVDIDATFCPDPELSILHAYDTLFTAGPCLLGASINRVLGRNPQTSHIAGEVHDIWNGPQRQRSMEGTSFVQTTNIINNDNNVRGLEHRIPGRTIILQQNKWDMGAHRFTFVEQNIVVAATDLPDSNDRSMNILMDNENNPDSNEETKQQHEHYSKAHARTGVYGVEHLYRDRLIAHEEIRIVIDATLFTKKQLAVATAVLE